MLVYGLEEEMVTNPLDFFYRRTGMLLFKIHSVHDWKNQVISYMADRLKWNELEMKTHTTALDENLRNAAMPTRVM
jgi:glycerol-3-phosphate dehydrogenase